MNSVNAAPAVRYIRILGAFVLLAIVVSADALLMLMLLLLQVFLQDGQLYAFKGLAGRLGPIGVHVALLMCLFGTAYRCVTVDKRRVLDK